LRCGKSTNYPESVGVIRHPARHFIHYLLSRRIYDTKAVIKEMGDFDLTVPKNLHAQDKKESWPRKDSESDFAVLCTDILKTRQLMDFPAEFEPQKRRPNPETRAFLAHWRIAGIWQNEPAVVTAIELLTEPPIRSALELYLLSPLAHREIARRLSVRFELDANIMNAAAVRAFGHYFWDAGALDATQWRQFTAMYRYENKDTYHAMLSAPRNSAGVAHVVSLVDQDPQLLPAAERYQAVSAMAFSMFMRNAMSAAPGAPYAAFTALNAMRMADDELEKHQGGSSDLLAEFHRIKVLHDQRAPMKITDAPFIQRPLLLVKNEDHDG
jgi:hypothetical protein